MYSEEVEVCIRNGKRKLEQACLDEAEHYFNKALRICSSTDLRALEGRTICFERKGLMNQAFDETVEIMKMFPESPQGYLRCGKLLRINNATSEAIKIYKKGLDLSNKQDKLYGQLEKQFELLQPKSNHFPIEIFPLIVKYSLNAQNIAKTCKAALSSLEILNPRSLLIDSSSKSSKLKTLLGNRGHLIVKGATALGNLLIAIKAGAAVRLTRLTLMDCDRVDPYDLSRAIKLGMLGNLQILIIEGSTSNVLLSCLLLKSPQLKSFILNQVICPSACLSDVYLCLRQLVIKDCSPENFNLRLDRILSENPQIVHVDYLKSSFRNPTLHLKCSFNQQNDLDDWKAKNVKVKWLELKLENHLTLNFVNLCIPKVCITEGELISSVNNYVHQLRIVKCSIKGIEWQHFSSMHTLWLEECVGGLSESDLDEIGALESLQELVIFNTFLPSFLSATIFHNKIDELQTFGLIECTGQLPTSLKRTCIFISNRGEFDFIKKERWDIVHRIKSSQ